MHIHTLLKFGGVLEDMTGSLIQASWEGFILEAGLMCNIFDFPNCVTSYIMNTWLTTTWQWCCKVNIQIQGENTRLTLLQARDTEIMRIFINAGYKKTNLAILNKC